MCKRARGADELDASGPPHKRACAAWIEKYKLLVEYVREHKKLPPCQAIYLGVQLGAWVRWQRRIYGRPEHGTLTAEQIAALEKFEGWAWREEDRDVVWWRHYDLLLQYVGEHKLIPRRGAHYGGVPLGCWVNTQRVAYCYRGTARITPERIAALEKIKEWYWRMDRGTQWQSMYNRLAAYTDEHGSLPHSDEPDLCEWVRDQQVRFQTASSRLASAPKKIAALEKLRGWHW